MSNRVVLQLLDAGPQKVAVIKVLREALHLGLKEAKDLVDEVPSLLSPLPDEDASSLLAALSAAGATAHRVATSEVTASKLQADTAVIALHEVGDNPITVIKIVRKATGLGLKEAKELVAGAPSRIGPLKAQVAADCLAALVAAGASAQPETGSMLPPARVQTSSVVLPVGGPRVAPFLALGGLVLLGVGYAGVSAEQSSTVLIMGAVLLVLAAFFALRSR